MKIFYLFILMMFINGCAQKDAFTMFNLTKEQRLSENSIQTVKIKDKKGAIVGMLSTLYLNDIDADKYEDGEYFYIYFYVKDKQELHFLLNDKEPVYIEKLSVNNRFSKLLNSTNVWNKYRMLKFEKTEDRKLTLKLKDKTLSFKGIVYKKED